MTVAENSPRPPLKDRLSFRSKLAMLTGVASIAGCALPGAFISLVNVIRVHYGLHPVVSFDVGPTDSSYTHVYGTIGIDVPLLANGSLETATTMDISTQAEFILSGHINVKDTQGIIYIDSSGHMAGDPVPNYIHNVTVIHQKTIIDEEFSRHMTAVSGRQLEGK